jgi:hypothetical protein
MTVLTWSGTFKTINGRKVKKRWRIARISDVFAMKIKKRAPIARLMIVLTLKN